MVNPRGGLLSVGPSIPEMECMVKLGEWVLV